MHNKLLNPGLVLLVAIAVAGTAHAVPYVQCPGDLNGDGDWDDAGEVQPPNTRCIHLAGGDGFARMADGTALYIFSFDDVTGSTTPLDDGIIGANAPAPSIIVDEGDDLYITLTNVGMVMRPDLSDPHSVHFHGFPNASTIFDGLPEVSVSINMGSSITYYYHLVEPGTYMYHCHVEATEHMQMGMLGNLYVRPAQNATTPGTFLGTHEHAANDRYVYNDGDGATRYDVEREIQIGSFDSVFHTASFEVQPLPFAEMKDNYPLLNGRGYPDTTLGDGDMPLPDPGDVSPYDIQASQLVSSKVTADQGETILLRLSNLNVTNHYTLTALGLEMKVVGRGARILRSDGDSAGEDLSYSTNSVTLGGGESRDVLIDTTDVAPGTYFLYTTNMQFLSNGPEDFGGMMTEIEIL